MVRCKGFTGLALQICLTMPGQSPISMPSFCCGKGEVQFTLHSVVTSLAYSHPASQWQSQAEYSGSRCLLVLCFFWHPNAPNSLDHGKRYSCYILLRCIAHEAAVFQVSLTVSEAF